MQVRETLAKRKARLLQELEDLGKEEDRARKEEEGELRKAEEKLKEEEQNTNRLEC